MEENGYRNHYGGPPQYHTPRKRVRGCGIGRGGEAIRKQIKKDRSQTLKTEITNTLQSTTYERKTKLTKHTIVKMSYYGRPLRYVLLVNCKEIDLKIDERH